MKTANIIAQKINGIIILVNLFSKKERKSYYLPSNRAPLTIKNKGTPKRQNSEKPEIL